MTRIAVVADIHGNLPALHAVVADIESRVVDRVVNLGDLVSGALWPRETLDFLMQQSWLHIAGNHDRQLVADDPATHGPSDRYAFERLDPSHIAWLATLPPIAAIAQDVLLCHGTPSSDLAYLLERIEHRRLRIARPAEVSQQLGVQTARIVLCGHSHMPRLVRSEGGAIVMNPGSVGLPAFDDTGSDPHVSETGSPHARYATLELTNNACRVSFHAVEYDCAAAAAQSESAGRPDWAAALRTGYVFRSN
ncbi:MAG: metallophosphoesterase family protein [bacterium]